MLNALRREPVLLGAALSITADGGCLLAGASTEAQAIIHGITLAWVAWGVRLLSTPTVKAEQRVEEAKYVGAVEQHATALAGQIIAAPPARPTPRARVKAPAK